MISFIPHPSSLILGLIAMGQPQPGEDTTRGMLRMMIPMLVIFAVFYLLLIRPQRKQQDELKKMLDALKVGDRVLTTGGIYGLVSQVKEKTVVVKIAENTKVEMLRSGVQQVIREEGKEGKKG